MNKVIYVPAYGKPVGKDVTKKVSTGEIKKGLLGGTKEITKEVTEWEQTGNSECKIDGERLSSDMQIAIEELNREGYEIISVTPVISGSYSYHSDAGSIGTGLNGGWGYGYGYGYSYTEGVSIIAKKFT